MNLFTHTPRDPNPIPYIEIVEPDPEHCHTVALPPEGNVKVRNYRMLNENIRAYTPTGDVHASPDKDKLVSRYEVCGNISPPRAKILELLRPEDPGRDALEAIVRPTPRRGLTRPLDDDTRRFLQRALQSPSLFSVTAPQEPQKTEAEKLEAKNEVVSQTNGQLSLADELREAEEEEVRASGMRQDSLQELGAVGARLPVHGGCARAQLRGACAALLGRRGGATAGRRRRCSQDQGLALRDRQAAARQELYYLISRLEAPSPQLRPRTRKRAFIIIASN